MQNIHPIMQIALAGIAPPPREVAATAPWAPPASAVQWAQAAVCCSVDGCPSSGSLRSTSCSCSSDPEAKAAAALLQVAGYAERMAEYRAALASFDWQFEFSDDHRAWAKGNNDLARLHRMQRELDPTGAIWKATPGARGHGAPKPRVQEVA